MPDPPSHRNTYAEKLWEPYNVPRPRPSIGTSSLLSATGGLHSGAGGRKLVAMLPLASLHGHKFLHANSSGNRLSEKLSL